MKATTTTTTTPSAAAAAKKNDGDGCHHHYHHSCYNDDQDDCEGSLPRSSAKNRHTPLRKLRRPLARAKYTPVRAAGVKCYKALGIQ